ncbi:MAG: CRISPR-associated endonuclease Cas2 [Minisyncoccia bacterium]
MIYRGSTKQKILLLLLGGLALSLNRSPKGQLRIIREIGFKWKRINQRLLNSSIRNLYESNLIRQVDNRDGTVTFILSKKGKEEALRYNMDEMIIPKMKWDKKWRIVMFDIPEKLKKVRDSLRYQLKRLGFIELQRSVFVFPYDCQKEIEYIVEFYNIKKFVRFIVASTVDNELHLKKKFDLG